MKRFTILLAAGLMFAAVLPVFAGGGGQNQTAPSGTSGGGADSFADAPLKSVTPVDSLPLPVKKFDASAYSYDDMSKRYKIEFLSHNYGVQKSNPDPIAAYISKKYNVDFTMTEINSNDYESVLSTRFAAGDYPDFICLPADNRAIAEKLYDQNLVIDTTLAMRYLPNYSQYFTKEYADFARYKNAYPMAPRTPNQAKWNAFLRNDWMKKLNIAMPKTVDDLLTYARMVTNNDPDGNGRKDTWFAGGAGGGNGFGMLDRLKWYFGENQYNVKNGKINNMVIDGTMKNYLAFLKTLNDEGLLAPDWYTVDWETFKSYSLNGRVGYVDYPYPNLLREMVATVGAENNFSNTSWDVWAMLSPISPTGKAAPDSGPSYGYVFPATLKDNPGKFKRVMHILDSAIYNGESYYQVVEGGGNEIYGREVNTVVFNNDGTSMWAINYNNHPTWNGEIDTTGLANKAWCPIASAGPPYMTEYLPGYDLYNTRLKEMAAEIGGYPKFLNNFAAKADPDVTSDITEFERVEFPRFVFGTRSLNDWDKFVKEWLDAGGREALTQVSRQLGCANIE